MGERYGAFLLRCRRRADGAWRVVVEHVQSGERVRLASLAATIAWLGARIDEVAPGLAEGDDTPEADIEPPAGG